MDVVATSLGGTINLQAGLVCWDGGSPPENLPESLPRRLIFTAKRVCKDLRVYPFEQLCWEGSRPFYRLIVVERVDSSTASFRIERTTQFNPDHLFGIVPSYVFKNTDLVYLLSDAEPSLYPGPRVVYVNDAFERMSGFTSSEIIGQTPRILQGEKTEHASRANISSALRSWERIVTQVTNYRKDGSTFRVELDITPVHDSLGWWEYWFSVQRDITNQERDQASRQHRAKLESLGELAAGVAHEINTPMQCIASNLSFLQECCDLFTGVFEQDEPQSPTPEELLRRIEPLFADSNKLKWLMQTADAVAECKDASQRVIEIVRAMKSMSHPGGQELGEIDFSKAVESAITVCRNRWKYVAELDVELHAEPILYHGVSTEVSQVVVNLIVNAADAIAEQHGDSGRMGRIVVRTRVDGDNVVLEVEDDGPGIPETLLERVFDPFFTTKEVGKGSGQGLAIIHGIVVTRGGGAIELRPNQPSGTLARITLPLDRPKPANNSEANTSDTAEPISLDVENGP